MRVKSEKDKGSVGDEIEPSALRQCIIWRFHLLASIRGGCCAIKGVSEVCVPVYVCVCMPTCVLKELVEWSSILLNRMGLPCSNTSSFYWIGWPQL